ncbi:putative mariner transposase [Trichonephila clavipes]|nr:putative mariner transposase [Trichonephila clavipes]
MLFQNDIPIDVPCHHYTLNMQVSSGTKKNSSPNARAILHHRNSVVHWSSLGGNGYLVLSILESDLHNAIETFAKLQQTYEDSVLSRCQVFRWLKAFSEGRESIEDEPRNGKPSISKTAKNNFRVRDLVRSDRRLTIRMIGDELDLNHTTVHQILTNELKMKKINAPCHTAISVNRFMASKNIHVAPQSPYSPDLNPCDFFLFPKLNIHLKRHQFRRMENI